MKENLENKIREALPRLSKIEKGQIFHSKYYGNITATKITEYGKGFYSIYGFDELEGLPRDNYYPRDLKLIGHPIKLNDVLQYLTFLSFPIGSYQYEEVLKLWFLDSVFLADQSNELKIFLNNL